MFSAGFARIDITPPFGSPLAGYPKERLADGTLDPLELCVLAVNNGEKTALIYSADVIYIMLSAATPLRKMIAEKCGVDEEAIFLHGLHQHTSIRLGDRTNLPMKHSMSRDPAFLDVLYRRFCDAGLMAIADMAEASVSVAAKETPEQISFIRRYHMKDGSVRANPGFQNPDVLEPAGEAENTVRLVRFTREGKKDIAMVNFSTHPDVIGGTKFSADWPGFVRRFTEKALPDVHCLVVNGPQGDTNHYNLSKPRIVGEEAKYNESQRLGRVISETAVSMWNETRTVKADSIFGEVRILYVPTNTKGLDQVDEAVQTLKDIAAGKIDSRGTAGNSALARIAELRDETLFRQVPVSVLAFGDVALVGYGGEPFTNYARASRAAAPDLFVVTLCLVNGGQGYLPDSEAYAEGGYGVDNSRFSPEVAPMTQGAAKEMLQKYLSERK
ncbi:MAG: hypothetical protein IKZ19_01120 [Clostridia bacterium]|nr:hypothetical protein [Clostridia bacterium]